MASLRWARVNFWSLQFSNNDSWVKGFFVNQSPWFCNIYIVSYNKLGHKTANKLRLFKSIKKQVTRFYIEGWKIVTLCSKK